MTQGHENVEVEQQINIEENEISKAEVKEIEPVEDTFHEELNQEVNENVKEQEQVPITANHQLLVNCSFSILYYLKILNFCENLGF